MIKGDNKMIKNNNKTEGSNTMSNESNNNNNNKTEVLQILTSKIKEEVDMRDMMFRESDDFKNNLIDMWDVGSVVIHSFDRGSFKLDIDVTDYSKDKFMKSIKGMGYSLVKDGCHINGCLTDSGNGNKVIFVVSDMKMLGEQILDEYRKEVS